MKVTLDGQGLFDELQLRIEAESFNRDAVERAVAGLDGLVSIDLGRRSRVVRQKGTLRASSRPTMSERIEAIRVFMDGKTHTLESEDEKFEDLRVDMFKVGNNRPSGSGVCVDYEIVYMQLAA